MEKASMSAEGDSGMVIVYTGHGKGKTSAALGLILRAVGHGFRVLMIQFLKGGWDYGELKSIERLSPEAEIRPLGVGCVGILDDTKPIEEHRQAAGDALSEVRQAVASGAYDIIILDEINIAVHLELIALEDVLQIIRKRPEKLTLVLTGRFADEQVIEAADLVTEMKEIKHPFQKGRLSQKGLDY